MNRANEVAVCDLASPQLAPYLDLRNRNWTSLSGMFIAEGPLLVQRLIGSSYKVQSILLDRKYYDLYASQIPEDVPLIVVEHEMVRQIVGFNFHRGLLGCGLRKVPIPILELAKPLADNDTWLGLIGVQDPENVGGMLRTAAGMGIQNVLIGPGTADPLSRRSLRVSMGNVLSLNLHVSRELPTDLGTLKQAGLECIATALDQDCIALESAARHGPLMLLMGNERNGLPPEVLDLADRSVKIDMRIGTDSLNVGVAAGIAMHYFCRIAPRITDSTYECAESCNPPQA